MTRISPGLRTNSKHLDSGGRQSPKKVPCTYINKNESIFKYRDIHTYTQENLLTDIY